MSLSSDVIVITPTLTVSTSAYSAGDCVGGILTLPAALLPRTAGGTLVSLAVTDASDQKAALEVLVFDAEPSGGTYTDNGALALSAADLSHLLARVPVATSDYVTVGSVAVATVGAVNKALAAGAAVTDLYAVVMATGTPTYAAGTDLVLRFGVARN